MKPPELNSTSIQYIQGQIHKKESGIYDVEDCLYRIASAADLIVGSGQITDSNRSSVEDWIDGFKSRHGVGDVPTGVFSG